MGIKDLGETTDFAGEYPEKVQEMKRLFKEARTKSTAFELFKKR